jgi:thiamine biosynthesis lipoprotein
VVTSGDYQRTYQVGDTLYHHIIDPETLFPSVYWRSVTIVCKDSGIVDALSTALFLLPREEGQKLLEQYDAEAMWVDSNGEIYYSTGLKKQIRT